MLVTAESELLDDDERYNSVVQVRPCGAARLLRSSSLQDLLIRMPGVTFKNYKLIMNKVNNLRELSQLSLDELTTVMGNSKQASLLHEFIHKQKGDLVLDIKSKASSTTGWRKRR